nr:MAG TPA: hypothetical protein [Bacteriophage sp.]
MFNSYNISIIPSRSIINYNSFTINSIMCIFII